MTAAAASAACALEDGRCEDDAMPRALFDPAFNPPATPLVPVAIPVLPVLMLPLLLDDNREGGEGKTADRLEEDKGVGDRDDGETEPLPALTEDG